MAAVVTEKIIEMFLILLGGVIVYKAGLIDDKTVPKLSNLLLMFISPLLIFQSYQMEFEMRLFLRTALDTDGVRSHICGHNRIIGAVIPQKRRAHTRRKNSRHLFQQRLYRTGR